MLEQNPLQKIKVSSFFQNTMMLTLLFLGFFTACSDAVAPTEETEDAGTGGTQIAQSKCPPEFIREPTEDNPSTCFINEEEMENVPENPTMDDLLHVDDDILDEQYSSYLTQEGSGKIFVYVGETKKIGVRAINNIGLPVEGLSVGFEILNSGDGFISEPKGSTLSAMNAVSDQFGVAAVDVVAGNEPTYFKVQMNGPDGTTDLTYQVNVIQKNISDNDDLTVLPPQQRCFGTQGNYKITNHYNILQSAFGSGFADTVRTIGDVIRNPGRALGNWIRDRIGGFVGDIVRDVVEQAVNWVLEALDLPDWVNQMLNVIDDLSRILTDLQIDGLIRVGIPDGENMCISPAYHKWEKLTFFWGLQCNAQDPNCGRQELNLTEFGVSLSESEFVAKPGMVTRNSVPVEFSEHQMGLNLGVLAITIVQNFILPERMRVNSLGEAIARFFPCEYFGDLAYSIVGYIPFVGGAVADLAIDACRSGIEALGNELTRQLIEKINVSTFTIKGNSVFKSSSGMGRLADQIKEGVWTGQLEGTFEGTRIMDAMQPMQPAPMP